VPYLNSAPFFRGLPLDERYELSDCPPRTLGAKAAAGEIVAGPLPLMDYLRLQGTFERLGHIGIAVRGRARSALLFSRKPISQLDGSTIAVTDETSTTLNLLRLLLEKRYHICPAAYDRRLHPEKRRTLAPKSTERRQEPEADALLLIGDEAIRFKRVNNQYPFETDVAFEWWLWQHLPFVFAVWAIRKDAEPQEKKRMEAALMQSLAANLRQLDRLAEESAAAFGLPAEELREYLSNFIYRLGPSEEEGMARFQVLLHDHRLL